MWMDFYHTSWYARASVELKEDTKVPELLDPLISKHHPVRRPWFCCVWYQRDPRTLRIKRWSAGFTDSKVSKLRSPLSRINSDPIWTNVGLEHRKAWGSTSHVEISDESIGRPKPRRPSNFSLSSWARWDGESLVDVGGVSANNDIAENGRPGDKIRQTYNKML